jgi:hypothetical protein
MLRKLALLSVILLSGCETASSDTIVWGDHVPMTPDFQQAVAQAVKSNLKDPYSAVMGPSSARGRIRNGVRELVVCGYVNAKNSFGGYNGMQPYEGVYSMATQHFNIIAMGDESPNAGLMIASSCRAAGLPIS